MSGRQSAYVDGLMDRYDEDRNGSLSKAEQEKISGSVKLIDVDGNGSLESGVSVSLTPVYVTVREL